MNQKRMLSILTILLMSAFMFAACGSNRSDDSTPGKELSIDTIKTIGDAFALDHEEDSQYAVSEGKVVFAFKIDDAYYRVIADISEEDQQAYMDIEFDDEDYDAKQHAIIDPLEITKIENLNEQMLSRDELDDLVGKTGKELVDEGWNYQGSYDLDAMEVWMDYGPFDYSVRFEGGGLENSDDFDIEEATRDMKVKSAEFSALGDATTIE